MKNDRSLCQCGIYRGDCEYHRMPFEGVDNPACIDRLTGVRITAADCTPEKQQALIRRMVERMVKRGNRVLF